MDQSPALVKSVLDRVAQRIESETINFEKIPEELEPAVRRVYEKSKPDAIKLLKKIMGLLRMSKTSLKVPAEEILSKMDDISVTDKISESDYNSLESLYRLSGVYKRMPSRILEEIEKLKAPDLLDIAAGKSSSINALKIT